MCMNMGDGVGGGEIGGESLLFGKGPPKKLALSKSCLPALS